MTTLELNTTKRYRKQHIGTGSALCTARRIFGPSVVEGEYRCGNGGTVADLRADVYGDGKLEWVGQITSRK